MPGRQLGYDDAEAVEDGATLLHQSVGLGGILVTGEGRDAKQVQRVLASTVTAVRAVTPCLEIGARGRVVPPRRMSEAADAVQAFLDRRKEKE